MSKGNGASIKILFCTDGIFPFSVGGIQRHSRLLIETLADRGNVELIVIHPHQGERVFQQHPQIQEIVVDPINPNTNYLKALYEYSKQIAEVAHRYPDHLLYAQGLTVWHQAEKLGKRLLFNPHGLEPFQPLTLTDRLKGLPYHWIYRRIFKHAARVIALGGKLTTILRTQVPQADENLVVLPNATLLPPSEDAPVRFQKKSSSIRCLFLGRFAKNKGITHLIEAARELQTSSSAFHFTLAGKGPLYESLKHHGEELPNIDMPGFVPDEALKGMFQSHDLFVLPTLSEGMPTVVLEAMAYGMPIIVTDVGATKELVDDANGYIIEKRSSTAIIQALGRFASLTHKQQHMMSEKSKERVAESFTWEQVAIAHEQVFEELLQSLKFSPSQTPTTHYQQS